MLHLDTGREWRGGQQQVLYLSRGLRARGHEFLVAAPTGSPLAERLAAEGLPVREFPWRAAYAPNTVYAWHRLLAEEHWDVVHTHTAHAHSLAFVGFRLPAPRPYHRPALVVSRRVDFAPSRDPLTRLKYTAARTVFVCVSDGVREVLRRYGVAPAALHVVHSGVEPPVETHTSQEEIRRELGLPTVGFLVGAIGQLVPHKGHSHLLAAIARLRKSDAGVHLVILGAGELDGTLRAEAKRLEIEGAVTFAGYRPHAKRYLRAFDLFVSSSIEEGLGTSILDAQAAGVAVVATTAGGSKETVNHEVTGLLVPPADAFALANAVAALRNDGARRRAMAEAGPEWIRARFSADAMVEGSLDVYHKALDQVRV